jgi:hypothetical protein
VQRLPCLVFARARVKARFHAHDLTSIANRDLGTLRGTITVTQDWDPERFKPLSVPDPITLSAGDVLYMPRGVMHQAFCIERESMHLTISLMPLTVARAV